MDQIPHSEETSEPSPNPFGGYIGKVIASVVVAAFIAAHTSWWVLIPAAALLIFLHSKRCEKCYSWNTEMHYDCDSGEMISFNRRECGHCGHNEFIYPDRNPGVPGATDW